MANDNTNTKRSDGGNSRKNDVKRVSESAPQTGQQSQGGPQQDDGDMGQSEAGQQPEIPKVGSRDAPGG